MTNKTCFRWSIPILICLLCLQTVFLVYFGSQKDGFHEDELATYTLSNYPDGFIIRTKSLMNNWVDGNVLFDVLTVSDEEKFDYKTVYENQERDVHPPLYYYIIHTISSLFQGRFSKWIGIVPNIIFSLLTSVFLFLISKRLLKNDFLAMLAVGGWAFSIGAVDGATFIRMYAMFTFLTVLFVFLHIKALDRTLAEQKIPIGILVLLFVCTFSGLLTQYYFSVFALFLCGSFLLYLIFHRRWRDIFAYLLAEFGAIASAVLYYPTMLTHIFGSGYRGQEAFRNLKNSDNFIANLKSALKIISNDMFNGWAKELICLCIVLSVIAVVTKFFHISVKKNDGTPKLCIARVQSINKTEIIHIPIETAIVVVIGIVLLFYTILISKVAPYQRDRYYMCLFPFLMLCAVFMIYKVCSCIFKKRTQISKMIALFLVLTITVCGLVKQEPSHLYPEASVRADELENYSGIPAIVLNDAYTWYATARLTEYKNYSKVYISQYKSKFSCLENAAAINDLTDGFLLYALQFSESDKEILEKIQERIPIKDYKKLCDGKDRVFFCTLED